MTTLTTVGTSDGAVRTNTSAGGLYGENTRWATGVQREGVGGDLRYAGHRFATVCGDKRVDPWTTIAAIAGSRPALESVGAASSGQSVGTGSTDETVVTAATQ